MAATASITPALLSVKDAAQYLGLSRSSVYKLREAGEISYVRLGGAVRIQREELDRLIAERTDVG